MIKIKRTVSNIVLVISGATLSACASFSDSQTDANGRLYIGAGALISDLEPDTNGVTEFAVDDTTSGGGTVLLGYDITPRWSVEGHLSDLGEATFEPNGSIDYQVGAVSGLFYFLNNDLDRARREGFHLFGRVGVGVLENDSEGVPFDQVNGGHLLFGFGGEYGLQNGLGFRLEGVSHDEDILYGQASILYRFGRSSSGRSSFRRPVAPPVPTTNNRVPVPQSTSPLLVTEGSPLDSDGDGILDTRDQCSNTNPGTPVDSDGCTYFDGAIDGIVFKSGSDKLTVEARAILGEVVDVLNRYPDARISVGAHTDSQGPGPQNLLLSKSRAIAVTRFLVDQGIAGSRLAPQAFGESRPIQSNETAAGRAANRRVEFNLL